MTISKRVQAIPPSGIRRFFDIAATMKDVISLGIGEPDFVTPPKISRAGIESIQGGDTKYTSNSGTLQVAAAHVSSTTQAPTVAVLVNLVFDHVDDPKQPIPSLAKIVYFMAIAAVWFGCSNAAREIVGERPIFVRERMVAIKSRLEEEHAGFRC